MGYATRRSLAGPLLALAVLAGALAPSLPAQPPLPPTLPATTAPSPGGPPGAAPKSEEPLRFSRNVPGDAKPILLDADDIHTWNENGLVVLLLRGNVLVQQSVTQTRFEQGVAWIDLARYQTTGILHMDLYAEGQVRHDTSLEAKEARSAILDLTTRGELRLKAHRGKVVRQDHSTDVFVSRGRAAGVGPRLPQVSVPKTPGPIQPVSTLPPVPSRPTPVQPPSLVPAPAPSPPPGSGLRPLSFDSKTPGQSGPAASEFVLAQATTPAVPSSGAAPGSPRLMPPRPSGDGTNESPTPPPLPIPTPPSESRRQPANNDPEPGGPATPPPPPPPPEPEPPPSSEGNPGAAPFPPATSPAQPAAPAGPPPGGPPRQYRILPRSGGKFDLQSQSLGGGRQVITVTQGIVLTIANVPRIGSLDVEADRAVIWLKEGDGDADQVANNLQSARGESARELEFYMSGHVVVRVQGPNGRDRSVLETEEIYYDTNRNVAVALNARLQLQTNRFGANNPALSGPIVLTAQQINQTGEGSFEATNAEVFSSKLISDPGLKLVVGHATIEDRRTPRTNLFGQPVYDRKTGRPLEKQESILEATNVIAELEGVPFFYTPYLLTDARDPLGPLETINFGGNRVFGAQFGLGFNVYKLLGIQPFEGTRWRVYGDYLSRRGPALGTTFTYTGQLFDVEPFDTDPAPGKYFGELKLYGIHDNATDILGAQPPQYLTFDPPGLRGRALWRTQVLDLPYGFNVVSQTSLLSDRNFLEQYYKREFDTDPNQANFTYVKQQQDNWAWSALGQFRSSPWITTTEWLPRLDAYLIGQDLFDIFTSNTQLHAGYYRLRPSNDPDTAIQGIPGPPIPGSVFDPTTRDNEGARFALLQELSLPFDLGPFRVVPYVKGALVQYTDDLAGHEVGRAWGGAGLRASIPFSRLYPDVCSELFNVKGINHKIVASANYFVARTNEPFSRFAQVDRLNDDATTQALREFRPYEPLFNTYAGAALATSRLYDPQTYAIRRLIDNRIDTLDDIQVLQLDLRQRLQTKRGFPGAEHIIDWMILDTSVSLFPDKDRDNFGKVFSFLEYNYVWNIGDRTTLESSGLYDPQDKGPRIYAIGLFFNRPDRTSFYVGYRQIDPLQSRLVTASVGYVFSPKYAMTFTASYDFGVQESVTNSLLFTRTGTDLQVSLGFTYNTLQNNFGAVVEIVPNLLPINRRGGLVNATQPNGGGLFGR